MSWLASFEVLPSPNHVLAKLAIFRGAEPSPHSPRATDSASVFHYYFKPFALFHPVMPPLVHRFHPPVFLTTSAPRQPPLPYDPIPLLFGPPHRSIFLSLSPSLYLSLTPIHSPSLSLSRLPTTTDRTSPTLLLHLFLLLLSASRLVPPGGDENFQTPRDRNRIVISRGSRPASSPIPSFKLSLSPLPLEWRTPKVLTGHPGLSFFPLSFFPSLLSIHLAKIKKNQKMLHLAPCSIAKSSLRIIVSPRQGIIINTYSIGKFFYSNRRNFENDLTFEFSKLSLSFDRFSRSGEGGGDSERNRKEER